jgi:hypothetical protein
LPLSDIIAGAMQPPQPKPKPSSAIAPVMDQTEPTQYMGDPLIKDVVSGVLGGGAAALRAVPEMFLDTAKENPERTLKWFVKPAEKLEEMSSDMASTEGRTGKVLQGVGSTVAAFPLAPLMMYDESFRAAKDGGADDVAARKAAIPGFIVNTALEYVGIGKGIRAVRAIGKIAQPGLRAATQFASHILQSSAWEGGTESVQQIVNNLVRDNYDIETDTFNAEGALDGAGEAGLIGAASSAILFGAGGAMSTRSNSKAPDAAETVIQDGIASRIESGTALASPLNEGTPATEAVEALNPSRHGTQGVLQVINSIPTGMSELGGKALDMWSAPLVSVVEKQGTAVGTEFGARARRAIDANKAFVAEWQEPVAKYQNEIAGRTPMQRKAFKELYRLNHGKSEHGLFSSFQSAVENDAVMDGLSPHAKKVVQDFRKLQRMVADSAVATGVEIALPSGDKVAFTGEEQGRRLPRAFVPEAYEILEAGPADPAYTRLAETLAVENELDGEVALRTLDAMREDIVLKRASFEVARQFKVFPTHLDMGGYTIPLLHSDPFQASQAILTHQASRLGYIKEFGQDEAAAVDAINRAMQEGGEPASTQMENLVRALQAIPVDRAPKHFQTGSAAHNFVRAFRMATGLQRTGLLTTSAIPNTFETLNTVPMTVGARRYLKAFYSLATEPHIDPVLELSRNVGRTIDVQNWNWNKDRALESVTRLAKNIGQTVFLSKFVNENINELVNAHAALVMAKDLKAGKGTLGDRMRLEFMRFSPEETNALMDGSASKEQYQALIQRVTETGQATTSVPAERSRAANNRTWSFWVAFDSYAQKTMDRTRRLVHQARDAHVKALEEPTRQNLTRAAISEKNLALWVGGAATAGAFSTLLRALVKDGIIGAASKIDEADEDWGTFWLESAQYALFSGMADMAFRVRGSDRPTKEIGKSVENLMPIRLVGEIHDVIKGKGAYAEYEGIEKFEKVLERNITAFRPIRSWAAVMGLGERDRELEVAISRYWQWQRKNVGIPDVEPGEPTDPGPSAQNTKEFRTAMRKATNAIRSGESQERVASLLKQAVGKGNPSASLYGRRLLNDVPKDMRDKFVDDMEPKLLAKLQAYDALLTEWAKAIK